MLRDDELKDIKIDEKGRYYFNFQIDKSIINEIIIGPLNTITTDEIKQKLIKAEYDMNKISVDTSIGKGVLRKKWKLIF